MRLVSGGHMPGRSTCAYECCMHGEQIQHMYVRMYVHKYVHICMPCMCNTYLSFMVTVACSYTYIHSCVCTFIHSPEYNRNHVRILDNDKKEKIKVNYIMLCTNNKY